MVAIGDRTAKTAKIEVLLGLCKIECSGSSGDAPVMLPPLCRLACQKSAMVALTYVYVSQ